jgi:hypothetical protein
MLKREEKERANDATAANAPTSSTAKAAVTPDTSTSTTPADANLVRTDDIPKINITCLYLAMASPKAVPCDLSENQAKCALTTHAKLNGSNVNDEWIMDSGASRTMCSCQEWFIHFVSLLSPIDVILGNKSSIPATGIGRVAVCTQAKGKWTHVVFQNVLFVPQLHRNLLSIPHLTESGAEI